MLRRWRGQLVPEGQQTGDGRIIQPGALTWDVPMPLAWMAGGTQHVDMASEAPVIGIVDTIERQDDGWIVGSGWLDDATDAGAEMVRSLEAGTASHGNKMGVSVDMDDMAIEMLGPASDELSDSEESVVASHRLLTFTGVTHIPTPARLLEALSAAAGDPVPDDVEVMFADSQDEMIMSVTRARLRGLTAVATPAFADAYLMLDDTVDPVDNEPVAASAADLVPTPTRPPASWFTQPAFDGPTLMTIRDDGQIFGHLAVWDTCHTAYQRCVTPPHSRSYETFMSTGAITCADGTRARTGGLVWGIPHADRTATLLEAFAHYEVPEYGFADVCVGEDLWGIWFAGSLRPHITEADVRMLGGLSISGDWRPRDGSYEFIAGLAVNVPGFPIVDGIAASATEVRFDTDMNVLALVAAGMLINPKTGTLAVSPCETSAMDLWRAGIDQKLDMILGRTGAQIVAAVTAAGSRIPPRR